MCHFQHLLIFRPYNDATEQTLSAKESAQKPLVNKIPKGILNAMTEVMIFGIEKIKKRK